MNDETEQVGEAAVMPADEAVLVDAPPAPGELPAGVMPSANYRQAVELGHVLAASGYFTDARDPAKAAVRIMIGLDIGLSPTAALTGIHYFEERGKPVFLIEAKMLAALIHNRPGYDYKIVERTDEKCTVRFYRNGEPIDDPAGPDVTYTMDDAKRAGLAAKDNWVQNPKQMLTWRAIADGQRLHFPEITSGQPIYTDAEFGVDVDEVKLRDALQPGAEPLTDKRAEDQRERAREVYDELKEVNPDRLVPGRFSSMIAGAEHSHERLDGVIATLEDLRDTEQQLATLRAEVASLYPAAEAKEITARAERKGSQRDRIDVLREAVDQAGETPDEKGDTDG